MTHLVQAYDAAGASLASDSLTHDERLHVERARHELGEAIASAEGRRAAGAAEAMRGGARAALAPDAAVAERCGCYACASRAERLQHMILCPLCGNKRCPRATHHDHACTGSNGVDQPGSRYTADPEMPMGASER